MRRPTLLFVAPYLVCSSLQKPYILVHVIDSWFPLSRNTERGSAVGTQQMCIVSDSCRSGEHYKLSSTGNWRYQSEVRSM